MRSLVLLFLVFAISFAATRNGFLCDTCLSMVNIVDEAMKHGDDVKKAVHDFCQNKIPSFLTGACEKIVANSLDFIIDALKDHKEPKEICENILLC